MNKVLWLCLFILVPVVMIMELPTGFRALGLDSFLVAMLVVISFLWWQLMVAPAIFQWSKGEGPAEGEGK